jgi:hypothetical protein
VAQPPEQPALDHNDLRQMEAIFVEGSVKRRSSRVEGRSDLSSRIVARRQRSEGFVKTMLTRGSASAPFWPKFNSPGLGEYFRVNFPGRGRERAAALFQFVIRCRRRNGGRASIPGWVGAVVVARLVADLFLIHACESDDGLAIFHFDESHID